MIRKHESYRPANGMEGLDFYNAFCSRCVHEQAHINSDGYEEACDIYADSMVFDEESELYPEQLIWIAGEGACCSSFILAEGARPTRCRKTLDLFVSVRA